MIVKVDKNVFIVFFFFFFTLKPLSRVSVFVTLKGENIRSFGLTGFLLLLLTVFVKRSEREYCEKSNSTDYFNRISGYFYILQTQSPC